ncbi:MAG TPA: Rossmann-like and DUF2520 domain-containing protein [Acidimicrobiales bacterium]
MKIAIIGLGRAGTSFAVALRRVGHDVRTFHHDDVTNVADVDLILLCVPDDALETVSNQLPRGEYVVAHVAGSRGLDELAAHARRGFLHPLAVLSSAELGGERLLGARFSVGGDELVVDLVHSLGGSVLCLPDEQRVLYHATAAVAANHLVALLGHVEVLAEAAGLSLDDFLPLVEQALHDVREVGASRALTGPASRADMATIDAHLDAIPESERSTYVAMSNAAFELAEQRRLTSHA